MTTRWTGDVPTGATYDARWKEMAERGLSLHGEADFVCRWVPTPAGATLLDAGCGTGRVAIELAARGFVTVGVDADDRMLTAASQKAPQLRWEQADLATLELGLDRGPHLDLDRDLGAGFDVAVMAGNVMIFVTPGTEAAVVAHVGAQLRPGGLLISGFQLGRGYSVEAFDAHAELAGLHLVRRFASWDEEPFDGGDYQVSIHRRAELDG